MALLRIVCPVLGSTFEELDLGRREAMFLDQHDVGFSFQDRLLVRVGRSSPYIIDLASSGWRLWSIHTIIWPKVVSFMLSFLLHVPLAFYDSYVGFGLEKSGRVALQYAARRLYEASRRTHMAPKALIPFGGINILAT